MKSANQFSLQSYNSFSVACFTKQLIEINQLCELQSLPALANKPFYILGEGSNSLFLTAQAPLILKMNIKGIAISESADAFNIKVGAGENWHNLVCYCLERGINGLENLALIPGSVGAAPVQNIGAYGLEFADVCQSVTWFEFADNKERELSKQQCQFAYRESIFKQQLKNQGMITSVTLSLKKDWQPILQYQGLHNLAQPVSAQALFNQVVAIRQAKLPDPKVIANAGSFFKNPLVDQKTYQALVQHFGAMPHYLQNDCKFKLAAGWLIEQAGLKGYRQGHVGVHTKQALVLVNYGGGTGDELCKLAKFVQSEVYKKFNLKIEPEVRLISEQGEVQFNALVTKALNEHDNEKINNG
jgi:UDP-N-acetylmuramate dehydrogenase